jgi:TetR/AcrR family fatty acid metabolism transcriptional regulator
MTSQSVDKRNLILESAEKVFLEKGYYNAKIDEIAQNAGIAKGTVYLYFKDKESIYISLIEKKLRELTDFINSVLKENTGSPEKLKKIYFLLCEYMDKAQKLQAFISVENMKTLMHIVTKMKKRIIPKVKKVIESVSKLIEEGIKEGAFEDIDPILGALLFMSHLRLAILLPMMEELYSLDFSIDKNSANKKILDCFFHGVCSKNSGDKKCS